MPDGLYEEISLYQSTQRWPQDGSSGNFVDSTPRANWRGGTNNESGGTNNEICMHRYDQLLRMKFFYTSHYKTLGF